MELNKTNEKKVFIKALKSIELESSGIEDACNELEDALLKFTKTHNLIKKNKV